MSTFNLDDLRVLMRESVGVEAGVDLDADITDIQFEELGYDSLALLELAIQVKRKYGVVIPDDEVVEMTTPRLAIQFINKNFVGAEV
jgi:act minimal PKS acyl carrier protein